MSILHLSALLALAVSAFAAPLAVDCGNTNIFVTGYLLKNFTLGPNADCTYLFNWRDNTGSLITTHVDGLQTDTDYKTTVTLYNDFNGGKNIRFGNVSSGYSFYDASQFFAPGTVKLSITTGQNSTVSVQIAVSVANVTKDANVQTAQVITGQQPLVVSDNLKYGNTYVYSSTSKIVFSVTTPGFGSFINASYFDSVFAYDGQGPTAKLIGSLKEVYASSYLTLTTNSLTLFPLTTPSLEGKVIINNQQNIAAFDMTSMFYFFSYSSYSNTSGVLLDSRDGPGTTSIVSFGTVNNQPDFPIITRIKFSDDDAIAQVYSGFPTNKMAGNYLKQFTPTSVANMSAQAFPGTAITFTLTKGYAVIYYSSALAPP